MFLSHSAWGLERVGSSLCCFTLNVVQTLLNSDCCYFYIVLESNIFICLYIACGSYLAESFSCCLYIVKDWYLSGFLPLLFILPSACALQNPSPAFSTLHIGCTLQNPAFAIFTLYKSRLHGKSCPGLALFLSYFLERSTGCALLFSIIMWLVWLDKCVACTVLNPSNAFL